VSDQCKTKRSFLLMPNVTVNGLLSLNFDVSLTVHLSITLVNDQLDAQIFNTFITVLYMYMFRAISCLSSGGQIVLIQHLVSSLSVSDNTRCCINTI
jgi:hypothetical protein